MSNFRLIGSSFEQGLRTPHYVNGRLLTAEDLHADQEAMLTRLMHVGRASGAGVISGLMVSAVANSSNQLQIAPGLGLNAEGQIVQLGGSGVTLALNITPENAPATNGGVFRNCELTIAGEGGDLSSGAYVLTAVPVSRLEGSVAVQAASNRSDTAVCARKWSVAGLEFKAIRLVGFSGANIPSNQRRNALAYWLFGRMDLQTYMTGLTPHTGLDSVDANTLTPCDLPLAVFYWDDRTITLVDNWAARRRVAAPYPNGDLGRLVSDARVALGEARFLQFQDQLNRVIIDNNANLPAVQATQYFRYLPPFGVLPVRLPQDFIPYVADVIRPYARQIAENVRLSGPFFGGNFGFLPGIGPNLSPAIVNNIAERIVNQVLPRITGRLSQYGFDIYTFFSGGFINQVQQVDAGYTETALMHSVHQPPARMNASENRFNILFARQSLDMLIMAAFIHSADNGGFSAINVDIPGANFDVTVSAQELQRVYQLHARPPLLGALGSDAISLVARMGQTNTPLLYAAFERHMPPPGTQERG